MKIKNARPGEYKPKCGKCDERFLLAVPPQAGADIEVKRLPRDSACDQGTRAELDAGTRHETAIPIDVPTREHDTSETAGEGPSLTPAEKTVDADGPTAKPVKDKTPGAITKADAIDATFVLPANAAPDAPKKVVVHASREASPLDKTAPENIARGATGHPHADGTMASVGPVAGTESSRDGSSLGGLQFEQLGGYRILRVLGRGAMGTVYLANQTSLDRQVALKTIQAQWCQNPATVARFTREAYAAAQLTHHNVVQIYDLGADQGVNFYSMEFVKGKSLDELVEQQGKLDPKAAIGYILQAARGLSFAHGHGMVHRDVKPANLLLSDIGVVKVADLGLVKTPQMVEEENATAEASALAASTANVTSANMAIGTPAYMAPEQAEDATGVDHRADIYSLGCTLYVLLTGQTPFDGATALEVITKHRTEPVVRPERIDAGIPAPVSDIVVRMIAKLPDDRFANLDEVIAALEGCLGAVVQPIREEHVTQLEDCLARYNSGDAAKSRSLVAAGFCGAAILLTVGSLIFSITVVGCWLSMLAAAVSSYFLVSGLRDRTAMFGKLRELIYSYRRAEWLTWAFGALVLVAVMVFVAPVAVWLGFAVVGSLAGGAFHFVFDRRLAVSRREPLAAMEEMLKKLRVGGMDELSLQQFVSKYGGDLWEEMFETLFGYDAKMVARNALRQDGQQPRKRFRGWRDPLIRRINNRLRRTREARERRHLEKIEAAALQATGLDATQARHQAENMAAAMIDHAAAARRGPEAANATVDPRAAADEKRARIKAMLAEARSGKFASKPSPTRFLTGPLVFFLGAKLRFLVGSALLVGCLLWMNQHGMFSSEIGNTSKLNLERALGPSAPLNIPVVGRFFDSFNPGFAGLMLLLAACFRGWKMTLFALPAAAIMVFGPASGIPGVAALGGSHTTSLIVGGTIALIGLFLGRTHEEFS
jgi:serine/threonine protein kinase